MYGTLLIDDEIAVRDSIRKLVPWEQHGFSVIGEASNGLEALDLLEDISPDVIITDIRMPYMDGMDFIKEVRRRYPPIVLIILSGYDEFTYAQTAIRYNVSEYVLKPVSTVDMEALLDRVKRRLDEDRGNALDIEHLTSVYEKVLPLLREKFLISLLSPLNTGEKTNVLQRSRDYGIDLDCELFMIALFEPEDLPGPEGLDTTHLTTLAMQQVAEDAFADEDPQKKPVVFLNENQVILLFRGMGGEAHYSQLFVKQVVRSCERLTTWLKRYLTHPSPVTIGSVVRSVQDIYHSYEDALTALNYSTILPDQQILFIGDLEHGGDEAQAPGGPIVRRLDQRLRSELASAIKLGTEEQITALVDKLAASYVMDTGSGVSAVGSFLMEMLAVFFEIASSFGSNLYEAASSPGQEERNLLGELGSITSLTKACKWCSQIAGRLHEHITGVRRNSHVKFIEDAKKFIYDHHAAATFGLEQICDMIGVSTSHFSMTFRRETGETFVRYLTLVRLEHAKDLLKNTELKSYEIAEAVGFAEPNYFSFCFKRLIGMSPSQYRREARQGTDNA